jgi:cyclic-di-GMP phosphodiesterase TipF (flagellum assembly factor)
MERVLIIATYLLFSATVGIAVSLFAGTSTGFLAAAVLALGCVQLHFHHLNRRARKIARREISDLRRDNLQLEQALNAIRARTDVASKSLTAGTTVQVQKSAAERQVAEPVMRTARGDKPTVASSAPLPQTAVARSYVRSRDESDSLETVRASLEDNRVELYLQPIVSLPQRKVRFYEALSRLRAADGSLIVPAQYIRLAAPAGLMPAVDNLLLFRCAQIVRRVSQKQSDFGIFCNISGDSLADADFFPRFLEYMNRNRDLAGQIVFEFRQDSVLRTGTETEANLGYLASLGFALSLDQVESLEFDAAKLKKLGFRYIKVRASTLAHTKNNPVAAAKDLRKLLDRHGISLIAERVEDERTAMQLLEFGVDFAQGYLFGAPRAVRDESLKALEQEPVSPIIPFRKAS